MCVVIRFLITQISFPSTVKCNCSPKILVLRCRCLPQQWLWIYSLSYNMQNRRYQKHYSRATRDKNVASRFDFYNCNFSSFEWMKLWRKRYRQSRTTWASHISDFSLSRSAHKSAAHKFQFDFFSFLHFAFIILYIISPLFFPLIIIITADIKKVPCLCA